MTQSQEDRIAELEAKHPYFEKSVEADTWIFNAPGLAKALLMKSERQGIWFVNLDGHKAAEVCHSSVPDTWAKQRALPVIQRLILETFDEIAKADGFVPEGECPACKAPIKWTGVPISYGGLGESIIPAQNLDGELHFCRNGVPCGPGCRADWRKLWTAVVGGGNYLDACNHVCGENQEAAQ